MHLAVFVAVFYVTGTENTQLCLRACVRACTHAERMTLKWVSVVIHMLSNGAGGCRLSNFQPMCVFPCAHLLLQAVTACVCVCELTCIFTLVTQTWQALEQRTDSNR